MTLRMAFALWLLMLAVVPVFTVQAQETVTVRAGMHVGFARMVFAWPKQVKYSVGVKDGRLGIRFERAFSADTSAIRRHLGAYIGAITVAADKKSLQMVLKKQVNVKASRIDAAIVVDLVLRTKHLPLAKPATASVKEKLAHESKPDPEPEPKSRASAVRVRGGEHAAFSRLVFDWPKAVGYKLAQSGGKLTVRFSRVARFDISGVAVGRLSRVQGLRAVGKGAGVEIDIPANATVKHFRVGDKVVVDIMTPAVKSVTKSSAKSVTKTATKPIVKPNAKSLTGAAADDIPLALGKTPLTTAAPANRPKIAEARARLKKQIAPSRKATAAASRDGAPRDDVSGGGAAPTGDITILAKDGAAVDIDAVKPEAVSGKPPAPGIPTADKKPYADKVADADKDAVSSDAEVVKVKELSKSDQRILAVRPDPDPGRLRIVAERTFSGAQLTFAWAKPTPLALFQRGGHLWVVFDVSTTADLTDLKPNFGVLEARQMKNRKATVLRLRLRPGLFVRVSRARANWVIVLQPVGGTPGRDIVPVARAHAEGGARVDFPTLDNGRKVKLVDPNLLDEMIVVPTLSAGAGLQTSRRYVDFWALATIQGLVILPLADGLGIEVLRDRVTLTSRFGLNLSARGQKRVTAGARSSTGGAPILDLAGWQGDSKVSFVGRKRTLQQLLITSPPSRRNVARLQLARFFVSHGFASEGVGLMRVISDDDASYLDNPNYVALRGVALMMAGRYDEGGKDLFRATLDRYPDISLWRGAHHIWRRDYEKAHQAFVSGASRLAAQPKRVQRLLMLDWLRAAVEVGDTANVEALLSRLGDFSDSRKVRATVAWLKARHAERSGKLGEAQTGYEEAIAVDYRPVAARARFDDIRVRLALEQIDRDQAIDQLQRLRFSLRGDEFELDLIEYLAELNIGAKNYRSAMEHLRNAVKRFPKSRRIVAITDKLQQVFEDLFLRAKADELSPVKALGLYYDFQDLTPPGRKGDEIIRKLADRLVGVELLDRAAVLLEHQVNYRLKGPQKARVGARLALVHLLDRKPRKAIGALNRTRFLQIPGKLKTERRHLRVRALADLGEISSGMELLDQDNSLAANLLRADIYWQAEDWLKAGGAISTLLGARWRNNEELSKVERVRVVQLAVAYYLSDDMAGLAEVRKRYGGHMNKGDLAETFSVITHQIEPGKTNFRDLAPAIAGIPDFEAFISNYRDKIRKQGLSAIN